MPQRHEDLNLRTDSRWPSEGLKPTLPPPARGAGAQRDTQQVSEEVEPVQDPHRAGPRQTDWQSVAKKTAHYYTFKIKTCSDATVPAAFITGTTACVHSHYHHNPLARRTGQLRIITIQAGLTVTVSNTPAVESLLGCHSLHTRGRYPGA